MDDYNELLKYAKPCPFCGSRKVIVLGGFSKYWTTCSNCGAEGSYPDHGTKLWKSPEEAIRAWNKRVN